MVKRFFSSLEIPSSVREIWVGWKGGNIVLEVYHSVELDPETESMTLLAYTRIAAHYLKDYSQDYNRNFQLDIPIELSHHEQWVYLKNIT